MKQQLSKLALAVGMVVMAGNVMAQSTANDDGTANATVIKPISITAVNSLEFGKIAVAEGTVTIANDGERTFSNPQNNPGANNLGLVIRQATFTVTGENSSTYAITLPASDLVELTTGLGGANETMAVNTFTSNPSGTGELSSDTGTQTINVGATLSVGANQVTGDYTGTFNVTVAYN